MRPSGTCLTNDALTAATISAGTGSTELVAHPLFTFRRVLVASPHYLKRRGEPRTAEALAKHDALTHVSDSDAWMLTCGERQARVRINVAFRSNALYALRELAVGGAGVALLPAWFVAEEVQQRALRIVLPSWQSEVMTVNALHRTLYRGELRVRALITHLRGEHATQQPDPARAQQALPPGAVTPLRFRTTSG